MGKAFALLILSLLILVSGCTASTGNVAETTKLVIPENLQESQAQETIEDLHKEFAEFEKSQTENLSEQNETQEAAAAETAEETENTTSEGITSEETDYECKLVCGLCEFLDNETCSCKNTTECASDGCCPSECNYASDSDCPNPNLCETYSDCDDSNPCTQDVCSGEPKNCSFSPVTECSSADGCCPQDCSYFSDSDCAKPNMVFSEIYYDVPKDVPKGDTGREWLEIYNMGELPIDVTKLKFGEGGTNHTIKNASLDVFLMSKSYAVIAQNATQFMIDYPEYTGIPFYTSFSLNNTGEPLMLIAGKERLILDYIFYNSVWGGNGTGFSLEKIDLNGPNTQENWNGSITEKGTPGQKNSISQ